MDDYMSFLSYLVVEKSVHLPTTITKINDHIWLSGSNYTQHDLEWRGIKRVLSIGERTVEFDGVEKLFLQIDDTESESIQRIFPEAFDFLKKGEDSVTLVHCRIGKSRSPSIVIAFLVNEGMNLKEAIKLVVTCRPGIWPNNGFIESLTDFATSLGRNNLQL